MKVFLSLVLFAAVVFAEPPSYRQQQQQQQQQQRYFFARQQEDPRAAAAAPYPARGWKPDGPAFNLPERVQQQPQQQYGAPQAAPQQQYGAPQAAPQQQYGAPQAAPQQQYGAPQAAPQQQYGPPSQPQVSIFNPQFARQQQQQQPAQQPRQQYGPPQQKYAPPQTQYGEPEFSTESSFQEIEEPTTQFFGIQEPETTSASSVNEFDDDADIDGQEQQSQGESRQNAQQQQQQERGEYYVALPDGRLQRVRYVSRQDLEAMRYFAKIRAENVEPLRGPIYAYSPLQKLEVTPGALQISAVAPVISEAPTSLTVSTVERKPEKLQKPKVDIKPLAQLQIQHDAPQTVLPLSSSYATYTANYQLPAAAPVEDRFILALP